MKLNALTIVCTVLFGAGVASADLSVTYDATTGILQLDTGLHDFTAVYVSTGLVDFTSAGHCTLCDGDMIMGQTFSAGYIAQTSQWVRTNPLAGAGLTGVITLATGPMGLTLADFPSIFSPGMDDSFVMSTSMGENFYGDVTVVNSPVVPAPGAAVLALLGLPLASWVRRRIG